MAVNEADKHDLFQALIEKLGQRRAETFMNLVTTVPWSEVATKTDLERFATKADLERFATKGELKAALEPYATKADVRAEVERMGRRIVMWVGGVNLGLVSLAFAAGRTL